MQTDRQTATIRGVRFISPMLAWKGLKKEWKLPDYRDRGHLIKIGFTQLRGQAGFIRGPHFCPDLSEATKTGGRQGGEGLRRPGCNKAKKKFSS